MARAGFSGSDTTSQRPSPLNPSNAGMLKSARAARTPSVHRPRRDLGAEFVSGISPLYGGTGPDTLALDFQ